MPSVMETTKGFPVHSTHASYLLYTGNRLRVLPALFCCFLLPKRFLRGAKAPHDFRLTAPHSILKRALLDRRRFFPSEAIKIV